MSTENSIAECFKIYTVSRLDLGNGLLREIQDFFYNTGILKGTDPKFKFFKLTFTCSNRISERPFLCTASTIKAKKIASFPQYKSDYYK
jgi:hypothetical protein